jgi:hypothetical protein
MKNIKIPKSNSGEQETIIIEKNMVIADPRSYRVYNPMPGSINIYSELFSESTH